MPDLESPEKACESDAEADRLRIACADPELRGIVDAWPRLSAKERRQLAALVASMVEL
jgi:hypothetical protein